MTLKKRLFLSVVLVMVVAGFFRFFKLDWDAGHHLHPDERFLTMVTLDLRWSESIYDYFDSGSSTLNPANVGHEFFVYGSLPLVMVKFLAEGVVMADYDGIAMVGRAVVASLDTLQLELWLELGCFWVLIMAMV